MPIRHNSRSETCLINQRRYHVRHWGPADAPLLVLLHGWMDCSATFQFTVDALQHEWHVLAPDWRGFGHSQWNDGSYYFPDYLADLDALLARYSDNQPVRLVGHSMGAMIAGIYAGVRPERIAQLALVEGFGLSQTQPEEAPGRYARWLKETACTPAFNPIRDLPQVAAKLMERSPHLSLPRAQWLAQQLTRPDGAQQLAYLADPRHKMVNPVLYRLEEAKACWRRIQAPVLWVIGGDMLEHPMAKGVFDTLDERRACFPQRKEVVIAQAGHMVQWDQPQRLAETLETFFLATTTTK
ncbi:MAG TPA: alpha/beta hydrolase [Chromobacteriaceae bacterium]|nr:alpha/beta hydrolase [Chromobacteriaceae bacterium]